MSKRIYVGNLPWSITKAGLEELFSSFGEIEDALVIANKYTGRSRGFGFVTFKSDADAGKAIKETDKKEVEGRKIIVKEALPLREKEEEQNKEEAGEEKAERVPEEVEKASGEKPKKKPRKRKAKEESQ